MRITTGIAALLATALLATGCATRTPPAAPPVSGPQHFATPRALVEALVAACRAGDTAALVAIVGRADAGLVRGADAVADRARCQRFVAAADTMTRLDPAGPDRLVLVVGSDDYPLPVPLVRDAQGWHLDGAAGAAELARRTVGANELRAIQTCRAFAAGAMLPANAAGYAYRVLPGPGARLVAAPLDYRHSGVMTFLVAADGTVYERDLGPDTARLAAALGGAAPDASWRPAS